jgi:predicted small lipoprotein YifL
LICYDASIDEGDGVTVRSDLTYARIAAVAALIAALGLAGCGRKSGLDLPPSAAVSGSAADNNKQGSALGADGKPVAPRTGPKTPTILDWLVD